MHHKRQSQNAKPLKGDVSLKVSILNKGTLKVKLNIRSKKDFVKFMKQKWKNVTQI